MTKKGFTLIELIVVIAIIAILAAIIAPNAFKAIEKAKVTEAIGDFKTLKNAIYSLYADTGDWGMWIYESATYPTFASVYVENFRILIQDPGSMPGWDGPYVERLKAKNPWGGAYNIQSWCCSGIGDGSTAPCVGARDIWLEFEDDCYPVGTGSCPVSDSIAKLLDTKIDDGDLQTGEFRRCDYPQSPLTHNWCYCTSDDLLWVFVHNAW